MKISFKGIDHNLGYTSPEGTSVNPQHQGQNFVISSKKSKSTEFSNDAQTLGCTAHFRIFWIEGWVIKVDTQLTKSHFGC